MNLEKSHYSIICHYADERLGRCTYCMIECETSEPAENATLPAWEVPSVS